MINKKVYPLRYLAPIEQKPEDPGTPPPPPPPPPPGGSGCKYQVGHLIKNKRTGAVGEIIEVDDQCRYKIRELTYDDIMDIKDGLKITVDDVPISDRDSILIPVEESRFKELLNKLIKGGTL